MVNNYRRFGGTSFLLPGQAVEHRLMDRRERNWLSWPVKGKYLHFACVTLEVQPANRIILRK